MSSSETSLEVVQFGLHSLATVLLLKTCLLASTTRPPKRDLLQGVRQNVSILCPPFVLHMAPKSNSSGLMVVMYSGWAAGIVVWVKLKSHVDISISVPHSLHTHFKVLLVHFSGVLQFSSLDILTRFNIIITIIIIIIMCLLT